MCLWSFHIITTRHLSSEGDGRDMGKLSCDHHMIIIVSPSSPLPQPRLFYQIWDGVTDLKELIIEVRT